MRSGGLGGLHLSVQLGGEQQRGGKALLAILDLVRVV
jgi:hypothetical protein